jgi:pimeloyl-ACP methyl ester carboxylesterase
MATLEVDGDGGTLAANRGEGDSGMGVSPRARGWVVGVALLVVSGGVAVAVGLGVWQQHPGTVVRGFVRVPQVAVSTAVRVWRFAYRTHDKATRNAYLVLPDWYGPRHDPRLPLVIAPHGRGLTGRDNVRLWGVLPGLGNFALVAPDGEGAYSWGDPGQISDLARMPELARHAFPWLRLKPRRIYAFGGSMGGQETLLLVARHPRLLAGAAAFDSVADFGYQYRQLRYLRCNTRCLRAWREPIGLALQEIAREEIGGTPTTDPAGYAQRSPLTYARQIARSDVTLQLWWSTTDQIVRNQQEQSGELFRLIRQINPKAHVEGFVGRWIHTAEMRPTSFLPYALSQFGLLPKSFNPRRPHGGILPTSPLPPTPKSRSATQNFPQHHR